MNKMEPKEKAQELLFKMKNCLYSDGMYDAKQCALVAVDEIIYDNNLHLTEFGHERILFWKEVKQELEKL